MTSTMPAPKTQPTNRDNLHAPFQKTDHSLPIAFNTQAIVDAVQAKLYPGPVKNNPFTKSDVRKLASVPR
jgi:hypothetical protein